MQTTFWSTFACTSLLGALTLSSWFVDEPQVRPEDLSPLAAQDGVIAISLGENETGQGLALIDSRARVMAVYHIHRETGEISLKSARKVAWDLQLDEFNGVKPTPREIRALVHPR